MTTQSQPITHILGYPRIGAERELKVAEEANWQDQSSQAALVEKASSIEDSNHKKPVILG